MMVEIFTHLLHKMVSREGDRKIRFSESAENSLAREELVAVGSQWPISNSNYFETTS